MPVYTARLLSTTGGRGVHQTAFPLPALSPSKQASRGRQDGSPSNAERDCLGVCRDPGALASSRCYQIRTYLHQLRALRCPGKPRQTERDRSGRLQSGVRAVETMLSNFARLLNGSVRRSFAIAGAQQAPTLQSAAVAGVRPRQWASTKAAPAVEGLTFNVDEKVQRIKHRIPMKR